MFKSKLDQGIIQRPIISPYFELFTFSKKDFGITDAVLAKNPAILKETNFSFIVNNKGVGHHLKGILTRDILLSIDGKNTRDDIIAKMFEKGYPESDVKILLVNLAYHTVIVSAEYEIDKGYAYLWLSYGITPRFYQDQAKNTKIYCTNLSVDTNYVEQVNAVIAKMGIVVVESMQAADLTLVLMDDYLQSELFEFNQQRLVDHQRWLPIKLSGAQILYGPIFTPDKSTVCLHCITNNMRNNREMRGFLEYNKPGSLSSREVDLPLLSEANIPVIIISIMKSLILLTEPDKDTLDIIMEQHKLLDNHLFSHDILDNKFKEHYTNKRPQCLSCGDKDTYNPDRESTPVALFKNKGDSVFTSGGMKATTAQKTLEKYQHLVSPLTGIITAIEISSPPDDPWMHVYWSGSNLAIVNRNFSALTNSIRSKSAGKGRSKNQAKVSAMCEALERYSGVFNGDEIRKIAKFSDFDKGDALAPNDLMQFSPQQYKDRDAIAAKEYRFYKLPVEDFDENALVEWSPVWSITQQKYIWMMCYQLYFSYDPSINGTEHNYLNHNFANPDSNGAASGNTRAEAFVQGFMELVERDAYAIWWYNRLSYPEVDLASFNDPYLDQAMERYQTVYNRKLWVLDITNDFGIPVFVAISCRTDKKKQDICISAGAHFDPHIAALRAVCELNQYISAVLKSTDEPDSYTYFDRECNDWWQNATIETDAYVLPDPSLDKITKADYVVVNRDINEEAQRCIDIVHEKNLEILVLDQTRPDVGLPVMKVMVPGMRHFWARFDKGRLFDVPVAMGKLDKPLDESELNPTPVFI